MEKQANGFDVFLTLLWVLLISFWCLFNSYYEFYLGFYDDISKGIFVFFISFLLILFGFRFLLWCVGRGFMFFGIGKYVVAKPKKIGFKLIILGVLAQSGWCFGLSLYTGSFGWFVIQTIVWAGLLYGTWKLLNVKKNGVSWWSLCK